MSSPTNQMVELVVGNRHQGEASSHGFRRCARRVPEVRAILKTPQIKEIRAWPRGDAIEFWHGVFMNTDSYEVASLALYYYQHGELNKAEFSKIKQWIDRCDCWEHSDDLSKIYADTLEQQEDWVLPLLRKWNTSRNPWKRRQSIVSLLEYTQKRKKVLSFATLIGQVQPLLRDSEYYVQKGVGWTLREIYNAYPSETQTFFEQHVEQITPTAWSAATEKLDKNLKKSLNERRKIARKRQ